MDACSVPDCDRPTHARGWCKACHRRWLKQPHPRPATPPLPRRKLPQEVCRSCSQPRSRTAKSGLCHACWLRRDAVQVEAVERYGIIFRRYPNSANAAHRRYYNPGGRQIAAGVDSLHREVHKREIGPVPHGWHVHHIDGDTSNNSASNLVSLPPGKHIEITVAGWRARGGSWRDRDALVEHLAAIRPRASEWHRSDEGREWHREHAYRSLPWARAGVQPGDG